MNPRVMSVRPATNYTLRILFSNGEEKIYDCKPLLNFGVFSEFQDIHYFQKAQAKDGAVVWPHDQDICPDTLYLESKKIQR